MRLILTLSLSQMYKDETSGGLFLLLLSSRRLLCRQVGLAGFILHSQVSHFLNCFSFIPPVCFSSAIRDFSYIAIFAPYQAWANALAGPCQQEGEEGEAPSHTHRWARAELEGEDEEKVRKWVRKNMRVRKWVGGGEEKWFQTGESAGGAESWLLVPECFTTSKLLSPSPPNIHLTLGSSCQYDYFNITSMKSNPFIHDDHQRQTYHQVGVRWFQSLVFNHVAPCLALPTAHLPGGYKVHLKTSDFYFDKNKLIWIIYSFGAKDDVFFQVRTILPRARCGCWRGPPVRFFLVWSYIFETRS